MTEEVKSCPFCGGKAEISEGAIYCPICEISFANERETGAEAIKEVEELWNARPIENELTEKIGKLEAENARLREALEEIKQTVTSAQSPVCSFHFDLDSKDGAFILETAENALKGNEK